MLPHGLDADLEQVVVGSGVQARGRADVVEDSPEIFNHIESRNLQT